MWKDSEQHRTVHDCISCCHNACTNPSISCQQRRREQVSCFVLSQSSASRINGLQGAEHRCLSQRRQANSILINMHVAARANAKLVFEKVTKWPRLGTYQVRRNGHQWHLKWLLTAEQTIISAGSHNEINTRGSGLRASTPGRGPRYYKVPFARLHVL